MELKLRNGWNSCKSRLRVTIRLMSLSWTKKYSYPGPIRNTCLKLLVAKFESPDLCCQARWWSRTSERNTFNIRNGFIFVNLRTALISYFSRFTRKAYQTDGQSTQWKRISRFRENSDERIKSTSCCLLGHLSSDHILKQTFSLNHQALYQDQ